MKKEVICMASDFTVTDKMAREVVLNILMCQRMNEGEIDIDIDNLFQELGGFVSKGQIKKVLDQLEAEGQRKLDEQEAN